MNRDVAFAIGMLLLSVILFAETFNFTAGSRFSVGPEVYPRYVLGLLAALSLLLLVRALFQRRQGFEISLSGFDIPSLLSKYWRTVAIFGAFALYVLLLPVLGFPVVTAIFLVGLQLLLTTHINARSLIMILVVACVATAFVYLIFTEVLHVLLP